MTAEVVSYACQVSVRLLTDLIVVQLWIFGFDKGMMALTIQDECIRRTSDLGFGGCPWLCLLCSWNDFVVSESIACRGNLDYSLLELLSDSDWSFNQIA